MAQPRSDAPSTRRITTARYPQGLIPFEAIVRHDGHAVAIPWAGPHRLVTLVRLAPTLTIDGWVQCGCGEVGTIRDGQWVTP